MRRMYHPYWKWEDNKAGLYKFNGFDEKETEDMTNKAKTLLLNEKEFFRIAKKVIKKWFYSAEQNLSNRGRNRQAWIGQASCCYKYGIPEYITKYGWRLLTRKQQDEANKVADKVISIWETGYAKKIS